MRAMRMNHRARAIGGSQSLDCELTRLSHRNIHGVSKKARASLHARKRGCHPLPWTTAQAESGPAAEQREIRHERAIALLARGLVRQAQQIARMNGRERADAIGQCLPLPALREQPEVGTEHG